MGRRYHSSKMHRMREVWAKHGRHKHRGECLRILEGLRRKHRPTAETFASVTELFRSIRRG
jgi:hypothetical protein